MIRHQKTRMLALLLAIMMLLTIGTACTSQGTTTVTTDKSTEAATETASAEVATTAASAETKVELEPYTIKWYTNGSVQPDPQPVYDEMNKILEQKINAKLEVITYDWGQYNDKMKIVMATGEEFDLCFTSSWSNDYFSAVSKGAYLAIDDLLKEYGKSMIGAIPEKYWPATKVGGKIYGIPNYQIFATLKGISVKKDMAEKYGLDVTSIKKLADLEPFLAKVKQGESVMVPYLPDIYGPMPFTGIDKGFKYDFVSYVLGIDVENKEMKVMNLYETPEAMDYFNLMHDWYSKGYIARDAASLKDLRAEQKSARYAAFQAGALKPGNEVDTEAYAGYPVIDVPTATPFVNTGGIIATLTAISKTSKDPARAMMFYDLMFSDKVLYNLMCSGIENTHYKKISEDTIEAIADSGYNPSTDWEFGNQFNGFYRKGQKSGIWEETIKLNETAQPSPLLGFTYNKELLKSENAQIEAIYGEYLSGLVTGTLDPSKAIPEMIGKMKNAGLDKVMEDMQKQIDEWRATNTK